MRKTLVATVLATALASVLIGTSCVPDDVEAQKVDWVFKNDCASPISVHFLEHGETVLPTIPPEKEVGHEIASGGQQTFHSMPSDDDEVRVFVETTPRTVLPDLMLPPGGTFVYGGDPCQLVPSPDPDPPAVGGGGTG